MERKQCCSRKMIEKNRRNHMKSLQSNLSSLLPSHRSSTKAMPLADEIDESVEHIRSLKEELEKLRDRKQRLMTTNHDQTTLKTPKIEIREMGSNLEVVLITGLDSEFMFSEIIRMLHEEGADVVNATFSVSGNSIFHTFHAQVGESMYGVGAAKVGERLRRYVN